MSETPRTDQLLSAGVCSVQVWADALRQTEREFAALRAERENAKPVAWMRDDGQVTPAIGKALGTDTAYWREFSIPLYTQPKGGDCHEPGISSAQNQDSDVTRGAFEDNTPTVSICGVVSAGEKCVYPPQHTGMHSGEVWEANLNSWGSGCRECIRASQKGMVEMTIPNHEAVRAQIERETIERCLALLESRADCSYAALAAIRALATNAVKRHYEQATDSVTRPELNAASAAPTPWPDNPRRN